MIEKIKAIKYIEYLDRILAGEEDIGFVEDAEIRDLLQLAKHMLDADLCNSEIRTAFEKLISDKANEFDKTSIHIVSKQNYELNEDELENVAAGIDESRKQYNTCPYCGSRFKKSNGRCPFCNH